MSIVDKKDRLIEWMVFYFLDLDSCWKKEKIQGAKVKYYLNRYLLHDNNQRKKVRVIS